MMYSKTCPRCGSRLDQYGTAGYLIYYSGRCPGCVNVGTEEELFEMEASGRKLVVLYFLLLLAFAAGIVIGLTLLGTLFP